MKKVLFAQLFILGFVFFIPLSVSLKTVFLVAALFLILITPSLNQNLWFACTSVWGRMALILFGFILLACLWSPAPYSYQALAVGKYLKLLYLPILAVGFINPQLRRSAINVYLLAMVLTSLASIIKSLGYFAASEPGTLAYNYIITGFMMALASYFAGIYFIKSKAWWRILYLIVLLLTSYQVLFINKGRTGYLIYFVLMCLLLVQSFSFKKALAALAVFFGVFCVVYSLSTTMQFRVHTLADEIRSFQNKQKDTSLGYRVQFHYYSKTLFKENTWIGLGTGGFRYRFAKDNPIPSWGIGTADPHSQYWMMLSEFGLSGFLLFLLFLGSLFLSSLQLKESKPILLGTLIAFCITSATDTIFSFSSLGYLLIVFSALCCGELLEKQVPKVMVIDPRALT